jgi:hypothetical protein
MAHNETKLIQMSLFIIGQGPSSETDYCSVEDRNTINANAYGYSDSQGSEDLYVVRDEEDTWRVVVDTVFGNPDYFGDDYLNVWEYRQGRIYQEYCSLEPVTIRNRTLLQKLPIRPYWARAHMKFDLLFTRKLVE